MSNQKQRNFHVWQSACAAEMRLARRVAALLVAVPTVTFAAGQFDGAYHGKRTLLRGAPPSCNQEGATTLRVKDGHVSLTYARNTFDAEVGADLHLNRCWENLRSLTFCQVVNVIPRQ